MGQTYLFHLSGSSMGRSSSAGPNSIEFVTLTLVVVWISGFLKNIGKALGGLKFLVAASFTSSLALSFGVKSRCPGTQCICKLITPFDLADNCWCC